MQLQRVGCAAATLWLIILPCACEDAQHGDMASFEAHQRRLWREPEPEYYSQLAAGALAEFLPLIFAVVILLALLPICMCVGELVGALIYSKCPGCRPQLEDARRRSGRPDFEYGLVEGFCQSGCITCWGCCCPNTLWSAMASSPKSKFWGLTFWQMLTLRLGLLIGTIILLGVFPPLAGFLFLPLFVMNVLHRQHLRHKFGLEHSTCSSVFKDVYMWLCCQPCATTQEFLQVGYTGDPTLNDPLNDDSARTIPLQMHMDLDGLDV